MQDVMKLNDLIQMTLNALEEKNYSPRTVKNYRIRFNHLLRTAKEMGMLYPSDELFARFLNEAADPVSEKTDTLKLRVRIRCINLLKSVMKTSLLDCSRKNRGDISDSINEFEFRVLLENFLEQLAQTSLSGNTVCSYKRIVSYFLIFCQEKGYTALGDIRTNDVTEFILCIYRNGHFKPTTITSALCGFRQFLSMNNHTKQFLWELPSRFPKEQKILEVYSKQELLAIDEILDANVLSKRDVAISRLLMETGLRGIDVCEVKLTDIDWERDCIRIVQYKTKQPLTLPLRNSYGNAIVDYILNERPDSGSEHLFLRSMAPYTKLEGAGALWCILKRLEEKAGVQKDGRISGSRFMRHNAASAMLRSGVPMFDISAVLGHRDPNVVTVYLSTDDETLSSCTLPMPPVRKRGI